MLYTILIFFFLLLGSAANLLAANPAEVRSLVGEWVATENAISREQIEWEEEKTLLRDLVAVAGDRVHRLEAALAETDESVSTGDRERATLLERGDELTASARRIQEFVTEIEGRLRALKPRLPEPLQEELAPLYGRLPKNPAQTSVSLGERMQTAVGFLNKIRQFNGRITVSESVGELPGRNTRGSMQTLWIGLAQAYYLVPGDAGFGTADNDGWAWHSRPELAGSIREAIALAEGAGGEPGWIDLPVQLKGGAAR